MQFKKKNLLTIILKSLQQKRTISQKLLFVLLTMLISTTVIFADTAAGLPEPTEEELNWFENHANKTEKVLLNSLAHERIINYMQKTGSLYRDSSTIDELSSQVVPFGEEVVSADSEDSAVTRSNTRVTLPNSVDNSTLNAFPPIGLQTGGDCVSWAITYYQLTHEVGMLYG